MEVDVDVRDIIEEDETIIQQVVQEAFSSAGITDFTVAELIMVAQNDVTLQRMQKSSSKK